jgi:hypothetical protein
MAKGSARMQDAKDVFLVIWFSDFEVRAILLADRKGSQNFIEEPEIARVKFDDLKPRIIRVFFISNKWARAIRLLSECRMSMKLTSCRNCEASWLKKLQNQHFLEM